MSASRKRARRTSTRPQQQRRTKLPHTENIGDKVDNNQVLAINKLSAILDDIIQHHLWPLVTDNDAIHMMQVDRALYAYYEAHVYRLKSFHSADANANTEEFFAHIISGPLRIANLSFYGLSLSTCKSILRARPSLVSVKIFFTTIDVILQQLLATFIDTTPTLQQITLYDAQGPLSGLATPLIQHRNITTFDVTSVRFTDEDARALADIFHHNNSITSHDLFECSFPHDYDGPLFTESLIHHTKLKTLSINDTILDARHTSSLCKAIKHPHSSITTFDFGFTFIRGEYANDVAVALSETLCKVTSLRFLDECLSARGVTALCNVLMKSNAQLQRLDIAHDGAAATTALLCAMIGANTSLRHITLHDDFNQNGGTLLGDALKCNTTLTCLELERAIRVFDNDVLSHIEFALYTNTTLTHVTYDDEEVHFLTMALTKNRHIQDLHKRYEINKT